MLPHGLAYSEVTGSNLVSHTHTHTLKVKEMCEINGMFFTEVMVNASLLLLMFISAWN